MGVSLYFASSGVSFQDSAGLGLIFWFGGLFPDLDVGSIPARWFGGLGFASGLVFMISGILTNNMKLLVYCCVLGLAALLLMFFKHRGPTHKYWLPAVLTFFGVFGSFQSELVHFSLFCFAGGVAVHLMIDGIFFWNIRKGWLI